MIEISYAMPADGLLHVEKLPLLFRGESNAHKFIIIPAEGNDFAGCTIQGRFVRSDNAQVDLVGGVSSGHAEITLSGECYQVAGRCQLTVYALINTHTIAIYSAVGNVFPSLGTNAAQASPALLTPYPVNLMLADQNLRSWWLAGETATLNYYGVTITQTGNEVEIDGTLTGDNTTSDRLDLEGYTVPDTEIDLTRGLTRLGTYDDLLLCIQPYHVYRFLVEYVSGSYDNTGLDPTYGNLTIKLSYYDQRRTFLTLNPVANDLVPHKGEGYVRSPIVPSISSQEEYESLGANVNLMGGGLHMIMPEVSGGNTATFDHYRMKITIADVTGLDYSIGSFVTDW